jgi:hypothetical protein
MKLWAEQYPRTELQQKSKEGNGNALDKNWIEAKERCLMK